MPVVLLLCNVLYAFCGTINLISYAHWFCRRFLLIVCLFVSVNNSCLCTPAFEYMYFIRYCTLKAGILWVCLFVDSGDVCFDKTSGFWLVHSVPHFPPPPSFGYSYPESGTIFGQTFLCVTYQYSELNDIGTTLRPCHLC